MPAFEQDLCLCFVYKNSLIAEHLFSFACIVYEKNMFYFDWFISRHVVKFFSFFLFFFFVVVDRETNFSCWLARHFYA